MSLADLPNELLIQIASKIDDEATLNALARSNHFLYDLLNDYLYRYNITHNDSSALLWAATYGLEPTIRKLLALGADTQAKTSLEDYFDFKGTRWNAPFSALDVAALSGRTEIVKLLLGLSERYTTPFLRSFIFMPMYYALQNGHDNVALLLMERIEPGDRVSWAPVGVTALHVASCLGLPALVRHQLARGADVHCRDSKGMTPLHYAMLAEKSGCRGCSRIPLGGMKQRVAFASKGKGYDTDVETVQLLLQAGADAELQTEVEHCVHQHSSSQLARKHPDRRMYRLFVRPAWAIALEKLRKLITLSNSR